MELYLLKYGIRHSTNVVRDS